MWVSHSLHQWAGQSVTTGAKNRHKTILHPIILSFIFSTIFNQLCELFNTSLPNRLYVDDSANCGLTVFRAC